jgi:hypothetical protein
MSNTYSNLSDAEYQNREAGDDMAAAHNAYTTPCCGEKAEQNDTENVWGGYTQTMECPECGADVTEDYLARVW